jgi:putative oxidoreductase
LKRHLERGVGKVRFSGFRHSRPESSLKAGLILQRLFSTFPEGWPGTGLVFLRAVMAIPLVQISAGPFVSVEPLSLSLQLLTAACSALLIIGLWTPIAGAFMALCELSLLLFTSGASMNIVLAALGAALAMLGPGAWSVDARLFGRKRIRIPHR